MIRTLKFSKGKDGKIRRLGYIDDGITKSYYGIVYSKDFKEVEFKPIDNRPIQMLIDEISLGERETERGER